MKLVISGYGRMGHEVEDIALCRNHEIVGIIDNESDWQNKIDDIKIADVIIDFSLPETALEVFKRCYNLGIPIVTGTTGWYDKMDFVKELFTNSETAFFYAPNFSIGVNVFFHANKKLANILNKIGGYKPSMTETHHIHKLDAPSGTAIKAAEDVINEFNEIDIWTNDKSDSNNAMEIISFREGEVNGNHTVKYNSDVDEIEISHSAKSRKGFALGAVLAAEFVKGRKGFFTMSDLLEL